MGIYIHDGPVNPAQVIAALDTDGCVVRAGEEEGTFEVDVAGMTEAEIGAALAGIIYSAPAEASNRATLEARAEAALQANATFLALASPTQAQTLAQVKTLTKEATALIRLALNLLDSTDGT